MIEVVVLTALTDNFVYLMIDPAGERAAVVDPGEATPVRRALADRGLKLDLILLTHHHADHVGGAAELRREFGCDVVCSVDDLARISAATRGVRHGDRFDVFGSAVEVIGTPGHTRG